MNSAGDGISKSKFASKFSMTISHRESPETERNIQLNCAYTIQKGPFSFQTNFLYTTSMVDDSQISSHDDSIQLIAKDGAILQIKYLEIVDSGNGVLQILAKIREELSENANFEFLYSQNNGESWHRVSLDFTENNYNAQAPIESGKQFIWTIIGKNQNIAPDNLIWNFWVMSPQVYTDKGAIVAIPCIITGIAAPMDITIERFPLSMIVHTDKERIMALANLLSDEEILVRREEHTFGVVLSYFDQMEGPLPIIGVPELLEDNFQFLMTLSDQAFNATGFVEETSEEKTAIFDIKLENIPIKCLSWAFAIDVLEARGGRDNMTLNLLVNPEYGDLVTNLSSEIIPTIRWIRSLIENKTPRENIATQMEGIRNLCSRMITSYQEIYG